MFLVRVHVYMYTHVCTYLYIVDRGRYEIYDASYEYLVRGTMYEYIVHDARTRYVVPGTSYLVLCTMYIVRVQAS